MDQPLAVVGITHSQTCLVLRGRLRALREAGFRVILISSPGVLLEEIAVEEGAETYIIPMRRGIAPAADVVSLIRVWIALRRLRPDLTEFSTPKAGLLGNLAAFLCAVPTRIYMLRGLRLETAGGFKRGLLKFAEYLAARCCHLVLCNSESLRQQALALGIAPAGKLRLLGHGSSNGVDVDRFSPGPDKMRIRLGIPAAAPVIGFVGRLTRDKGVPVLVEAFERLLKLAPDAWLLLVGWFDPSDDALSGDQRAFIASHPRILHSGFVADTAAWYRAMDLMVLPTFREGFPNVVLEAAASGIPVIGTVATGARDAVLPGVTGMLVPVGDAQAIADAALHLLNHPQLREAMGQAARRRVMEHFVHHQVLDRTVALYRDLLNDVAARRVNALTKDAAAD
ncbi:MAG TPA: glycosyltransferase family 4 protein [Terracidiphilus sp.]|nr:glycosyltransferase family 4 protein [Terracidiphilus sp.]